MNRRDFLTGTALACSDFASAQTRQTRPPNFIFILTGDQRYDAMGCTGNPGILTPNMDALARRGVLFTNCFVTTSVSSASRAATATGRYGSSNGVMGLGGGLDPAERTFVPTLRMAGYRTGFIGKWRLEMPATPTAAGFDSDVHFVSDGPRLNRKVLTVGEPAIAKGFIEDYLAGSAVDFLETSVKKSDPFFLHVCTQLPSMNDKLRWEPADKTMAQYRGRTIPIPVNWKDELTGKPAYLKEGRHREMGEACGYGDRAKLENHIRQYYSTITDLDRSLGKILGALDRLGLRKNTYIFLMGDNGWFLGEHGFSGKVLAYEESVRIPLVIAGPGIRPDRDGRLAMNIDVAPTILELAGLPAPESVHGKSLKPLLDRRRTKWRGSVYYEALDPALGSWPVLAVRNYAWKYIQTFHMENPSMLIFEELYDLEKDPGELQNLSGDLTHRSSQNQMRNELEALRSKFGNVETSAL